MITSGSRRSVVFVFSVSKMDANQKTINTTQNDSNGNYTDHDENRNKNKESCQVFSANFCISVECFLLKHETIKKTFLTQCISL